MENLVHRNQQTCSWGKDLSGGVERIIDVPHSDRGDNYPKVSFIKLFRYADKKEKIMTVSGIICGLLTGTVFPFNVLLFRQIIDEFVGTQNIFKAQSVYDVTRWIALLAAAGFILSFTEIMLLRTAANNQTRRIRQAYFKSVVKQDVAWFNRNATGDIIGKISENIASIEKGIGSKVGEFMQNISGYLSGIFISLSIGWKLTLVGIALQSIVVMCFISVAISMHYFTKKELSAYAKASSISGEVFSIIKTVIAFSGQKKEAERYGSQLKKAEKVDIQKSTVIGAAYVVPNEKKQNTYSDYLLKMDTQ